MKLSSLPYIVKKEILDHLSINDIFFLSLCSKNTKNFIIQTQKYQFKKVENVTYFINGEIMFINITMNTDSMPTNFMCLFRTPEDFLKATTEGDQESDAVEEIQVNELKTSVNFFRSPIIQNDLHPKYCSDNAESIIEAIHDHLYELLGHHTKFWLKGTPKGKTHFLPKLRNIQLLDIWGGGLNLTRIDEFLSRSTCLEYFSLNASRRDTLEFERDSKIYELDTLYAGPVRSVATGVMKYFNGRHAFLDCHSMKASNVIQFLNEWKSGEKFRYLEVIALESYFNIPKVRRSVEFKELDTAVVYSFTRKFQKSNRLYPCQFESRSYMVRQSDGCVASVLLSMSLSFVETLMKLSSLPYIVKKEILDHLSLNQIFFLSLCSKNTKNFIKQTQKCQFEKIERIEYSVNDRTMYIDIHMASGDYETVFNLFDAPLHYNDQIIKDLRNESIEEVRVNVLGTSIDFYRSPVHRSDLHIKYCNCNVKSIIETIHNHLYELVGRPTKFWLSHSGSTTNFLPMLYNIQVLDIFTGMYGCLFATTRVDELLSKSTCLEYFLWNAMNEKIGKLENKSKIYQMDTVEVSSICTLAKEVIKYFDGRHAFLKSSSIEADDIVQFLTAWKSGETFRNLEVISMEQCSGIPEIRRSVDFKELDTDVEYSFVRKFEIGYSLKPCQFKSNLYLVRESDGHVASVLLGTEVVFVGVWNMTESAFLEKFQPSSL